MKSIINHVDDGEYILSDDPHLNNAYQSNPYRQHLAILTPGWIELILEGRKTIESRLSKVRCAPFGKVNQGDTVFMKESSGLVKGMFTVAGVKTFENLSQKQIWDIYEKSRDQIFPIEIASKNPPPFKWLDSKHATLIHIENVSEFSTHFAFPKKDRRAWVVLDRPLVKV